MDRGPVGRVSFDEQAATGVFDARAGFPEGVSERIADAVRSYTDLRPGDLIVEIGAGTGLIGQWLARPPIRYLGLDRSRPMLDVFRSRAPDADIECADADQPWPVADHAARAVFGSRVFPLLDRRHLLREAKRVAHPDGAVLVHGTIRRDRDSPKDVLRRQMHERLRESGLEPRPAGRLLRRVFEDAAAGGATILAPLPAARWVREVRPLDVLDEWRQKYSMGGVTPPAGVHAAILADLERWAAERYANPADPVPTEESYVLEGVML
jgi:SAM-dependent methyltransferase